LSVFAFLSVIPAGNLLSLQNQSRRKSKVAGLKDPNPPPIAGCPIIYILWRITFRLDVPRLSLAGEDFLGHRQEFSQLNDANAVLEKTRA
jgi:hypothetical protein